MPWTERTCCTAISEEASTTCTSKVASTSSSSVARKAATSLVGSFWMKPTVSVSSTSLPPGSACSLLVGSSVANSKSSAYTSWEPQRVLSSVDLPAFVYPTMATTGRRSPSRRLARSMSRCACTAARSSSILPSCLRKRRRSSSSWVSPEPLRNWPPPLPPLASIPAPCVRKNLRRGSMYFICAAATCSLASLVRARCEKMTRMSIVRSSTCTCSPHASVSTFWMLRPWAGVSSSSKMTVLTRIDFTKAAISSSLP